MNLAELFKDLPFRQIAPARVRERGVKSPEKIKAERLAAVEAIRQAEATFAESSPALQAELDAATEIVREAKAAKAQAEKKLSSAQAELDRKTSAQSKARDICNAAVNRARSVLIATQPEELIELHCWLLSEDERTRNMARTREVVKKNSLTGSSTTKYETNVEAVQQRRAAIARALRRVEALRLEVTDDLADQIAAVKDSIPPEVGFSFNVDIADMVGRWHFAN